MPHSYVSSLFHVIFSTKERRRLITDDLASRLWPYLGGIARENHFAVLAVGGVADHTHLLLSLPATMSVSKAVQLIKGGSSKWIHDTFRQHRGFAWQEGYGAFSIGIRQIDVTIRYIRKQAEHHKKQSFEAEFLKILKRHGIEYDPRYVFG